LGISYGLCTTLSIHGKQCDPEDDVIIPAICRGDEETKDGMKLGINLARVELGLPILDE
jgi:hypothetical protein